MSTPQTKAPTKKAFHFPKTPRSAKEKSKKPTQPSKSNTRSDEPTDVTVLEQTAEARGLPAKSSSEAKAKRPKKDKLVRESFAMA
ncbi:hypothetical protein AWB81_02552 [Caballeronia arationis]|jgi:hypothetical protein|uniref:Uncharacterized protein n=1 Tax=Caballeronia arationis TaxID=1777142 RepID=A0A7Z7IFP6_9BURK|nr:hypothetical protein [Caballeronia arationis]SAK65342.1 hypothetical protein AWB81_02552 [Caballeronia arationis]SOE89226.1 hypothetical protein SAMN05446927_7886 [Caballeronia arationis]